MKVTNLFNFFGIVPYQYNVANQTYGVDVKWTFVYLFSNIITPTVALFTLGVLVRDRIFPSNQLRPIVFAIRVVSTVVTIYVNIIDNYYGASFHMQLLQKWLIPCSKTEAIIYRKSLRKVVLLVIFYIYYEVGQPTFVVLYGEQLDELLFYMVFYFLEMVLILNMLYIDSNFIAIQEYLKYTAKIEKQTSDQSTTKIMQFKSETGAYGLYILQKTLLVRRMSFRLILLTTNTYVVSSALIYLMLTKYDIYKETNSFLEANMLVFNAIGSVTQLIGLYSVCYEAQQCTNQEQELARKLTDLKENFPNHGEESPSATMMKINVLYRPPAISAYGLFDINLNFFYQMIAAITTQCVILFQFQSFEKKVD